MIKQGWGCSDGQFFESEKEAQHHEEKVAVVNVLAAVITDYTDDADLAKECAHRLLEMDCLSILLIPPSKEVRR